MDDLGTILRSSYRKGGLSEIGSLAIPWEEVVGPAIAKHCRPVGLKRGILHVSASSPTWAHQLGFFKVEIQERVNEFLGRKAIRDVRFDGRGIEARGEAPDDEQRLAADPLLTPEQNKAIDEATAAIVDDGLRDRLRRVMALSQAKKEPPPAS